MPSLYIGGGIGKRLVFSVHRSLDQEEPCRPDEKMVEHHLEILGLKVDVAPGRYFGGGFERAACVVAEELRDVIGAPRHTW